MFGATDSWEAWIGLDYIVLGYSITQHGILVSQDFEASFGFSVCRLIDCVQMRVRVSILPGEDPSAFQNILFWNIVSENAADRLRVQPTLNLLFFCFHEQLLFMRSQDS